MNQSDENKIAEQSNLEELLRQVSSQAALLAGFSFAGLTMDLNSSESSSDHIFTILVGTAMGLHILALCISGLLLAAFKYNPEMNVKWKKHFDLCWGCYLFGLMAFLFSLPVIIQIRIPAFTY